MNGTITISRLRLHARHGVLEQETRVGNEFEVTLSVTVPMTSALTDDELEGTVNYADLVDVIRHEMATPSKLIEHVAWRISRAVTKACPTVVGGSVTVTKLCPPLGVQVEGVSCTFNW